MMELLVLKEKLKIFYGKHSRLAACLVRFLLAFATFYLLNQNIGFMEKLKNPMIVLGLSLVCAFLPYSVTTALAAVFLLAHLSHISVEIALIVLAVFLLLLILYYVFQPGDSYLLLVVPILFFLKVPYVAPLIIGLSGGLVSVLPMSCGIFVYYTIGYVRDNAGVLTGGNSIDIVQKYSQIVESLFANKLMLTLIAAFAVSTLVVYLIRNLSIDYAWTIAIVAGTVTQLVIVFIGDFMLNVSVALVQLLVGAVVSALLAGVYQFFVFAVDYTRTEYLQFEDDDYHYYVKAVPKIVVSAPDVKVQKINPKKAKKSPRPNADRPRE